jgi:hypothetical protein
LVRPPDEQGRISVHRSRIFRPQTAGFPLLVLFLVGCSTSNSFDPARASSAAPIRVAVHCESLRLYRLYFGAATPDGIVNDQAWGQFVDQEIVPNFVSGFTVLHADGQWLGDNGKRVSEATRIVEIVAGVDRGPVIRDIAAHYKKQFHQDAVLVLTSDVGACLE